MNLTRTASRWSLRWKLALLFGGIVLAAGGGVAWQARTHASALLARTLSEQAATLARQVAEEIDPKLLDADGRCVFAATVELEDLDSGQVVTYQIVGEDEADIKAGKISVSSPIARALIGKYAGNIAEVQAPGGVREYEILDVRYE